MVRQAFNDAALSPSKIKKITSRLLVEQTELARADLGLVFGSYAFCDELSAKAATLYHQGYFGKVLVMGGPDNRQGCNEARYIKARMHNAGIPASDILTEEQSANTQENVEFGKIVADRAIGLENIHTVLGIGQLYAARRYMMTLKKHWPEVLTMHASVNGFDCARKDWPQHEKFRQHVLSEWRKLSEYPKKGYIRDINLHDINRAVRRLRRDGAAAGRMIRHP